VKRVKLQSPQLSQKDDFVCSNILLEPTITRPFASFEQPSIDFQRIGAAEQVDHGGHGTKQLNSTFNSKSLV